MSAYKIHYGLDGYVKGFGPNVEEYQPYLEPGDTIGFADLPPSPSTQALLDALRYARDTRLANTDKYLFPDFPINVDDISTIKAYRQALRDLPDQPGAPWDGGGELTPWPIKPV